MVSVLTLIGVDILHKRFHVSLEFSDFLNWVQLVIVGPKVIDVGRVFHRGQIDEVQLRWIPVILTIAPKVRPHHSVLTIRLHLEQQVFL